MAGRKGEDRQRAIAVVRHDWSDDALVIRRYGMTLAKEGGHFSLQIRLLNR
jgi:hypothetical protein